MAEAQRLGLSELVEAVEVPTEDRDRSPPRQEGHSERKFLPGYVLAKLTMTTMSITWSRTSPR
jgi:transcriptional antiterminator NusG